MARCAHTRIYPWLDGSDMVRTDQWGGRVAPDGGTPRLRTPVIMFIVVHATTNYRTKQLLRRRTIAAAGCMTEGGSDIYRWEIAHLSHLIADVRQPTPPGSKQLQFLVVSWYRERLAVVIRVLGKQYDDARLRCVVVVVLGAHL